MTQYSQNPSVVPSDWYATLGNFIDEEQLIAAIGRAAVPKVPEYQTHYQLTLIEASVPAAVVGVHQTYPLAQGGAQSKFALVPIGKIGERIDLSEAEYIDIKNGVKFSRALFDAKVAQANERMKQKLLELIGLYQTAITQDQVGISDWVPLFRAKAASGTLTDPQDLNATPGTLQATGFKMTGTGVTPNIDAEIYNVLVHKFLGVVDTISGRRMWTNSSKITIFISPSCYQSINNVKIYDGEKYTDKSILQGLLDKGVSVIQTEMVEGVGKAYSVPTEDTAFTCVAVCDIKENFQLKFLVNEPTDGYFAVEGFYERMNEHAQKEYVQRISSHVCNFIRPFYSDGVYKKAMCHISWVYLNDVP